MENIAEFRREWIQDYKFLKGDTWGEATPTDAEAEKAFAAEFPHLTS